MSRAVKSADFIHSINSQSSSQRVRRRGSSALQPTISSQRKARPEPRFQKVVTSQVLSQMRKDSRLISKNPERFLEGIVKGNPQPLSTESFSSFLHGFSEDSSAGRNNYANSLQKLDQKCRLAKSRTLLLNLGSNPAIRKMQSGSGSDRASSSASVSSYFGGAGDDCGGDVDVTQLLEQSKESLDQVEVILQSFLDEIRVANVDNLEKWVGNKANLNDFELPFGLPSVGLKIPFKNTEQVTEPKCKEFIRSAIEEFFLLDAEYHAKLEELFVKILDNFRELELVDWAPKDSALLFHIMHLMQAESSARGHHFSKEKLATELSSRIFPIYSREEIISQKFRLKVKRALEEKRDSILKDWVRDKELLRKKINSAWEDIQKRIKLKSDFNLEKRAQQGKCQYWINLLEEMRNENRRRIRTIETLVEPLEEKLGQRERLKERQERLRRKQQKQMVDNFRTLKLDALKEYQKRQEVLAQEEEKRKKVQQIQNKSRVHIRQQEFEMKRETAKELQRRMEEERQAKLEMLERTKEKVEIDYHPANVLFDTHASLVRSHEIQLDLIGRKEVNSDMVKFFQERYSFSAETLWNDTRVRVEAKLREAGLIDNSYARHVLLAMQPKPKPHLQSQIKFDEGD